MRVPRALPAKYQNPRLRGWHMVARRWSREAAESRVRNKKEYEPRRMAGWHKGLHYIVRCLFLMHCKLMKPSGIFIPRIMSPLTGVPICFSSFPGVSPLRGSTAGLPYGAPRRGSGLGSLHSRIIAHQAPICRAVWRTEGERNSKARGTRAVAQ